MIILGIDPGTRRVGYGIVEKNAARIRLIEAGLLKIERKDDLGAIGDIKKQIDAIIKKFKPDVLSIERIYFVKNQKTAIKVAEARGVLLSSALESGLKIEEYSPNEVKMAITGYGLADKKAVLKMVKLALNEPDLKIIDDASDALALAIIAGGKRS